MADPKIDRPSWLDKAKPSPADTAPVRVNVDLANLPRTRAKAKALGVNRYYTGKPCKNGHTRERITRNGNCVRCRTIQERERLEHPRFKPMKNRIASKARKRRRVRFLEKIAGGAPKCVRCGCTDLRFLECNHKAGGGTKDRQVYYDKNKRYGDSMAFVFDVLAGRRAVDDLEVLCRPCNAIHYLESKYGPVPLVVTFKQT